MENEVKIEIELDDEVIQNQIAKAVSQHLYVSYGEIRGNLVKNFVDLTQDQVLRQINALDLSGLIREAIDNHLVPTIQDQTKKIIEREAAKAIKKTMAEVKA